MNNTIKLRNTAIDLTMNPAQFNVTELYKQLIEAADEIDRLRAIILSDHFEKEE